MVRALNGKWDVFISHASEDKEDFVRSLAEGLKDRGLRVWFDETSLTVGDSLRESIDRGLSQSRFGIVVLSPHFFSKQWPQNELNGLATREAGGLKIILPVWHNITLEKIREASPILADRVPLPRARVWTVSSRSSCRRSLHPPQDLGQLPRLVHHRKFLNNLPLERTSPPVTQS